MEVGKITNGMYNSDVIVDTDVRRIFVSKGQRKKCSFLSFFDHLYLTAFPGCEKSHRCDINGSQIYSMSEILRLLFCAVVVLLLFLNNEKIKAMKVIQKTKYFRHVQYRF